MIHRPPKMLHCQAFGYRFPALLFVLLLGISGWCVLRASEGDTVLKTAPTVRASMPDVLDARLRVHIGTRFHIMLPRRHSVFNPKNLSIPELIPFVMNHERLTRRLWAFGQVLLPSLASQTCKEFDLYIYYSVFTPANWTAVFAALVAPYPFAHLVPVSDFPEVYSSFSQLCPPEDSGLPFITTRLDDDDGLAPKFVERLRNHALAVWAANESINGTIVTMSNGYVFGYDAGRLKVRPVDEPFSSAGASLVTKGSCKTVYGLGMHNRLGTLGIPVIIDTSPRMWAQIGDATFTASKRKIPMSDTDVPTFRTSFPHVPLIRGLPGPGAPGCWEDVHACLQINREPASLPSSDAPSIVASIAAFPHICSPHLRFIRYEPSLAEETWGRFIAGNLDGPHCPPLFGPPYAAWVAAWVEIATLPRSQQGTAHLAAAAGHSARLVNETMSVMHFVDACSGAPRAVLVEPLLGFMRDPRPVCPQQAAGLALTQPRDRLQSKETTVRDDSVLSAWRRQIAAGAGGRGGHRPRVLLFDLGASRYGDTAMPGFKWLVKSLESVGLRPDHVWAWEASKTTSLEVFTAGMPKWLRAITTFFNVPVVLSCPEPIEPSCRDGLVLDTLATNAHPEDIVVLKLDIGSIQLEAALVERILADAPLRVLVDEFYFEHHYLSHGSEMGRSWGRRVGMKSIRESFDLFQKLRRAGILAHVWP
jgi:hypothetical protein